MPTVLRMSEPSNAPELFDAADADDEDDVLRDGR
jgi:hypothetical protein